MIQFKIPLHTKVSTNKFHSGAHWSERSRLSNEFHLLLLPFKRKFEIKKYPISIRYDFQWKGKLLDTTNCGAMCKLLEDGMRNITLLVDDTPKYVAETVITSAKGLEDCVYVTISSFKHKTITDMI